MLDGFDVFPLPYKLQQKYWIVEDRIVSIHEPHVRPIVRGKARAKTEFGAKIHLSLVDGFAFLDMLSWDAFNEGNHLTEYVEEYRNRFGFYPAKVLADKLYCTRENRKWLKKENIKLAAKAVENHVRPGERNPIEGKFGQAKNGYGMNRIRARLRHTSQSWIASIILVLNLVKLAGMALSCLSFSAWQELKDLFRNTIGQILDIPKHKTSPVGYLGWF